MKHYYSLSDFPDRKSAGKNFIARCPQCDTTHLYISKAKGFYHCFYAGCGSSGILTDYCKNQRPFFTYPKNSGAGTRLHPSGRAESRGQELCSTGTVYYIRQPCGRYDEHESGEECCECD